MQHPKWLLILFFPIKYYALEYSGISYDWMADIYEIEGVMFEGDFFYSFAKGFPEGCYFKFLKRENGTVYVERVEKPL